MIESWTSEQLESFAREGFLIVEQGFIGPDAIATLRERFDRLFAADYETGVRPDEVNWVAGRDPEDLTPADLQRLEGGHLVAARVLSERTGRLAAELMDWPGVRLLQDNLIWKPPGTKSLGMDQHGSYLDCLVPPEMVTCWIDARRHLRRRGDDHVRRGVTPLATVRREPE
jgi:2-oxoglutarate-dependent dioxygenase